MCDAHLAYSVCSTLLSPSAGSAATCTSPVLPSTMEYHTSEGLAAGGTVAPGLWRSKGWGESESGDSCQEVFCCGSVTTVPKRDSL